MEDLYIAASRWDAAADSEAAMAKINVKIGSSKTNLLNEKLYRAVAESIRLEIKVGEPVCHRCFKTLSSSVYIRANGDTTHECVSAKEK